MFTGIIEEIGVLRQVKHGAKSSILTISAGKVTEGIVPGDSICTNGVCLTATKLGTGWFEADVMAETLRRTNLGGLKPGDKVNLERALRLCDRFGGHIVSGHIDGIGTIRAMEREDNAVWVTVEAIPEILNGVIQKGSIAIDGISLTVAYADDSKFKVSVIPHTGEETILLHKKPGDTVNLENDVIGKYVQHFMCGGTYGSSCVADRGQQKQMIDEDYLRKYGFM